MPTNNEKGFYNNGQATEASPCSYSMLEDALYIYLSGTDNQLIIWNIQKITSLEQNGEAFLFRHGYAEVLIGNGPIATAIQTKYLENKAEFKKRQGLITTKSMYVIVGVTAVFLFFCTLIYFYFLPWAGEKAATLVPVETEIQMGNGISEALTSESTTNDSVNFYLAAFVKELKMDDTYPVEVKLINSEEINAFALPGGKIYVYSGILQKLNSSEELVALLGHELTHVNQRHSLKSIFRALGSSLLLNVMLGDASGIGSGVLAQADQFKQLDYSRELETEADLYGLEFMIQNKVNPKGMLGLLTVLKTENAKAPQLMKYLSTHPDTEDRITRVSLQKQSALVFPENQILAEIFSHIKSNLNSEDGSAE